VAAEWTRRVRGAWGLASALFAVSLISPAGSAVAADDGPRLLEVQLDPEITGMLRVGVRNAGGQTPSVQDKYDPLAKEGRPAALQEAAREVTRRFQPSYLVVDTSNMPEQLLSTIQENVKGIAAREFGQGSQLVVVADQKGAAVEARKAESVGSSIQAMLDSWTASPADDKNPEFTTLPLYLQQALTRGAISKGRPWALVFSSLCVDSKAQPPELQGFNGPIRFITWDTGLGEKCLANREAWLTATREALKPTDDGKGANVSVEVYWLDKPEDNDKVKTARNGRDDIKDESMTLSGLDYSGGALSLAVSLGEGEPWLGGYTDKTVPEEWSRQAVIKSQQKSKVTAAIGLVFLVIIIAIGVLFRARTSASAINKWEAVGEAEEIQAGPSNAAVDPDAWNATIFQLTGAMPVLKDIPAAAAQLGPSASSGAPPDATEQTVADSHGPSASAASIGENKPGDAAESVGKVADKSAPSTGMTVAMPVYDDGTGYEADVPFEIGVLLNGKPVARKTKKFRKVFSIGRATDNRVVMQKDDTVHRYHVVIRPAMGGKEWWLEVSPTATNRTNLNGKDLKAGGRYRLPARYRLQLGEATEVRGRLAKG